MNKCLIDIARMASLESAKTKAFEDYNLNVSSNAILEHIAQILESQPKGSLAQLYTFSYTHFTDIQFSITNLYSTYRILR